MRPNLILKLLFSNQFSKHKPSVKIQIEKHKDETNLCQYLLSEQAKTSIFHVAITHMPINNSIQNKNLKTLQWFFFNFK